MRSLDKTGIYLDCKKLRRVLQRAQKCMTKADRIIYGTPALQACGNILANFILAYDIPNERNQYIRKFLAEFHVLKVDIETMNECGIIKETKNAEGEQLYSKEGKKLVLVGVEDPKQIRREVTELIARIDIGMSRWMHSLSIDEFNEG